MEHLIGFEIFSISQAFFSIGKIKFDTCTLPQNTLCMDLFGPLLGPHLHTILSIGAPNIKPFIHLLNLHFHVPAGAQPTTMKNVTANKCPRVNVW